MSGFVANGSIAKGLGRRGGFVVVVAISVVDVVGAVVVVVEVVGSGAVVPGAVTVEACSWPTPAVVVLPDTGDPVHALTIRVKPAMDASKFLVLTRASFRFALLSVRPMGKACIIAT